MQKLAEWFATIYNGNLYAVVVVQTVIFTLSYNSHYFGDTAEAKSHGTVKEQGSDFLMRN